jgi:hypothetical protein
MSRRQIAVTDGETGYKSKIKSILDAPLLYVLDEKYGPDHRERTPDSIGQTTRSSRKSSTKKMRLFCLDRISLRPAADLFDIPGFRVVAQGSSFWASWATANGAPCGAIWSHCSVG